MEATRRPRSWTYPALFLAGLAIVCALQWQHRAYAADLSANPDEAAHFVTGLMARAYLLDFPWPAPLPFAQSFYESYPKVAIGHWPPLFYLAQAVWMAPFGGSVASALLLMAVITAATAVLLVRISQPLLGLPIAASIGAVFLIAPLTQKYSRAVMAEMPLTLLVLVAAIAFARYLSTRRAGDAVWFGLAAAAAILTKPNGLALALLPPIAIALARRFRIVAERAFWIPALIVLILCGPWYVLTARLASNGWSTSYDPSWLLRNPITSNAVDTLGLLGVPMLLLAGAGVWLSLSGPAGTEEIKARDYTAVMAALGLSTWIFISVIVPVRGDRHLLPLLPPLLFFSGVACRRIVKLASVPRRTALAVVVAVVAIAPVVVAALRLAPKYDTGTGAIVAAIESDRELDGGAVLVSSEGFGEGTFIARLAESDRGRRHRVLRASQVLATSNWGGADYQLAYATPEDVDAALRRLGVAAIVVDMRPSPGPDTVHHQQLVEMLSRFPAHWQATGAPQRNFTLYRASHDSR
jgi:4-amino-4-deoxy-L-arabinose transferase-like glycosyltransferase